MQREHRLRQSARQPYAHHLRDRAQPPSGRQLRQPRRRRDQADAPAATSARPRRQRTPEAARARHAPLAVRRDQPAPSHIAWQVAMLRPFRDVLGGVPTRGRARLAPATCLYVEHQRARHRRAPHAMHLLVGKPARHRDDVEMRMAAPVGAARQLPHRAVGGPPPPARCRLCQRAQPARQRLAPFLHIAYGRPGQRQHVDARPRASTSRGSPRRRRGVDMHRHCSSDAPAPPNPVPAPTPPAQSDLAAPHDRIAPPAPARHPDEPLPAQRRDILPSHRQRTGPRLGVVSAPARAGARPVVVPCPPRRRARCPGATSPCLDARPLPGAPSPLQRCPPFFQ